jgi:cystathionine beta-lyase family protein involved in aluminum resistance
VYIKNSHKSNDPIFHKHESLSVFTSNEFSFLKTSKTHQAEKEHFVKISGYAYADKVQATKSKKL